MITTDANFISVVHEPKWSARIYRDGKKEGIVLTPGEQFSDELQSSNGGSNPVCAMSVAYFMGCQISARSLLNAEIEKRKMIEAKGIVATRTLPDSNEDDASCLINYTLLYPLNDPKAERLPFAVRYRFVKRETGVLRFEVRARDFFIERATEAATEIFESVAIKS